MREDHSSLLIHRLAASIVDDSLPLKDVEKELRGSVAEVAVKHRGLGKREIASRCGVTEKSIDNYLRESRANPKSPEREISRLLQDGPLSLEEIYDEVRPILSHGRHFTLDDAKRALEKLIRTGEAEELPGKKYRGSQYPAIRSPKTVEAYRDLVDQKAKDLDYVILTQKGVSEANLPLAHEQKFARVVDDTNLVRIDFTVDVPEEDLPAFYEKLSAEIARLTLKYEKKKGASRVRLIVGMRAVTLVLVACLGLIYSARLNAADPGAGDVIDRAGQSKDSWELDTRAAPKVAGGGFHGDPGAADPDQDEDEAVDQDEADKQDGRKELPVLFIRGDATMDLHLDISDILAMLSFMTQSTYIPCVDAADVNDDGSITIVDPVRLIRYLFSSDAAFQNISGTPEADQTQDDLGCAVPQEPTPREVEQQG